MKRSDDHDLAAPYVLDALDRDEMIRFERHLAGCDRCAHEVRVLSQDATRLGRVAALIPPPEMRERVMAAVRATPQEPAGAPGSAYGASSPYGAPRSHSAGPGPRTSGGRSRARAARRPRSVRYSAVLAGFGLAASAVLGVFLYRTNAELQQQQAAAAQVNQVLSASDATANNSSDSQGRGITAVVSRRLGRAVVTAHGLPNLQQGQVYQLWLTAKAPDTTVRSVGLLGRDPGAGASAPLVATGLTTGSAAFAVTVEPAGGSQKPTTTPLTQLALTNA